MLSFTKRTLAKDVMSKTFLILNKNKILKDSIELMLRLNLQEIFVTREDKKIIGLITLRDVSTIKLNGYNENLTLENYMNTNIITIDEEESLSTCRDIMIKKNIGRLPVIKNGELIGTIREREIRNYFYMKLEEIGIKLNRIINSIHEAVAVIDDSGYVMIWNKNAEKLYNVKAEDIIGKKMKDFFPESLVEEVLENKKPIENKYHTPRDNTYVVVSALPIFVENQFLGVVSTDRDITEVKKLSEKLEKATKRVEMLEKRYQEYNDNSFSNIVGKSNKMIKVMEIAKHVSKTQASILITGESGTGKEVFSRAIHDNSERKGLFVPVNCSAIPMELFESELFGYEAGAFTGANKKGKMGIFELANKGTVFLDEIGDMPLSMQVKLLRVLQEREVRRVGGEKSIKVDVRIISATNKNLSNMIETGKFREDLYYRLNVVEIELPPLRERGLDIRLLIDYFLDTISEANNKKKLKLDKEVISILENYKWKGNIRELKNTIEHLIVLSKDSIITSDVIPRYIVEYSENKKNTNEFNTYDLNEVIKDIEIKTIKEVLQKTNNNKTKAAKILNIPRGTLYYKLELYNLK